MKKLTKTTSITFHDDTFVLTVNRNNTPMSVMATYSPQQPNPFYYLTLLMLQARRQGYVMVRRESRQSLDYIAKTLKRVQARRVPELVPHTAV